METLATGIEMEMFEASRELPRSEIESLSTTHVKEIVENASFMEERLAPSTETFPLEEDFVYPPHFPVLRESLTINTLEMG